MNDLLKVDNVTFSYSRGSTPAVHDVNLTIHEGTKTVILGANGAGKSTLFGIMNALYKPDSGQVLYKGEPFGYRKKDVRKIRSDISILFQNPDDMLFKPYVEQDVAYGPENLGLPKEEVEERVSDALLMVGMSEYRDRPIMRLSYGQRKRVALAGIIAMRPKVLILDEPTAGLDPQMSSEVMEIAEQLHRNGTTVIMSSHDTDLTYAWADEVQVMRGGRCIFSGRPEDFYSDTEAVYLAGLLAPKMFLMNDGLASIGSCERLPIPRTQSQFSAKITADNGRRIGVLHILAIRSEDDINCRIAENNLSDLPTGIYGMSPRRAQDKSLARIDFMYNGPENCIMKCLAGQDSLILCDPEMVEYARRSADFINSSGYGKLDVVLH